MLTCRIGGTGLLIHGESPATKSDANQALLPKGGNGGSDCHPGYAVDFSQLRLAWKFSAKFAGLDVGSQVIRYLLPQQFAALAVEPSRPVLPRHVTTLDRG